MTTKTSPSRRSPSRASKTGGTRKRGSRSTPRKRAPAKTPVHTILSPWARDAVGIGLVVLGLLAALGIWFDRAGPVGGWLTWTLRAAFGVAAVASPVVGLWWGVILLRDIAREDRVRMFIGFSVLGMGVLGIVSLLGENPAPSAGYRALAWAGGFVGAVVAYPLSRVISVVGAVIVCLGLAALGGLIFSGTPVSVAWARLRDFFTAADVEEGAEPETPADEEPEGEEVPKRHPIRRLREVLGPARARRGRRGARGGDRGTAAPRRRPSSGNPNHGRSRPRCAGVRAAGRSRRWMVRTSSRRSTSSGPPPLPRPMRATRRACGRRSSARS